MQKIQSKDCKHTNLKEEGLGVVFCPDCVIRGSKFDESWMGRRFYKNQ